MIQRDSKGRFLQGNPPGPGRTSGYAEWMNDQAYRLALLGLTDEEMAEAFGISHDTLYRWQNEHSAFSEAIQKGKVRADANVAHSLYKRATGMVVTAERAMKNKDGEVVIAQTKTEIPPDTGAAVRWLANRQRGRWTGADASGPPLPGDDEAPSDLKSMSNEQLQERINVLQTRRTQSCQTRRPAENKAV